MTTTIETLVPERLWQAIEPLLPTPPPRHGGRPRVDDRACLTGIVYQLRTGMPGGCCRSASSAAAAQSPVGGVCATGNAPGCGSGLHHLLLDELGRDGQLDWSRASLDSLSVRAKRGAA